MILTPGLIATIALTAITGGIIGALATRISLHHDLHHLWDAHAQLWEDIHQPRHAIEEEE